MSARPEGASGTLFLLDAMSLAFRAFFALPTSLATETGVVTNALHGFAGMLVNVARDHRPGGLAVAFDLPGDTFRHEIVVDYKAGRAETPDILLPQFDMIREVLVALGVPIVEAPGYEADDVLATLATQARDRGCDAVVVTGDRDCFQLVEDPHLRVLYNRRGVSDYSLYDEAGIVERTGVPPRLYPELAALRGDPSDNLPGVPGIGEKTAAKLLTAYGSLDALFSHLDELTPKLRESLAAHEPQVRTNASAIPLVRDVPLAVTVGKLDLGGWDLASVRRVFETYELRTLWRRTVPLLAEGCFGQPAPGSDAPSPSEVGDPSPSPPLLVAGSDAQASGPRARGAAVASHVEPAVPAGASDAVAAVRALAGTGPLALAARWDGAPGRSPLRGVVLVEAAPPGSAAWISGALLEDSGVARTVSERLGRAPVLGHGVKELLRSLVPLGIDCRGLAMDVEVASYLLDPSTGDYGLGALAARGAGEGAGGAGEALAQLSLDVGEEPAAAAPGGSGPQEPGPAGSGPQRVGPEGPGPEDAAQAAADALFVAAAVPQLSARLDAEGLRRLHDEVELPLVRVLARMEVAGIRVDVEELRRMTGELATECSTLVAQIHALAGHDFNVNSTPQLRTVLYTELGLAPGRKTKTGYSTDAATLETLRETHPLVDKLLRYRELEKLRSTYGETLLAEVAPDGRIHATFRQTVARTGRISSERPNLHNIPARRESGSQFRRAFVPEPGWRFLVADYDQVELRVIAHLSGDPGLIEAFTAGQDIHRTVASGVYGVAAEEVTKEQRDRAKMVSYGLAYGMEAYGLARRLATGVDEAGEIMDRYFHAFPKVRAYMLQTVAEARERGYTETLMGRKRPLPELHDRNFQRRSAAERQAMNAGIQGLAADVFKTALVKLDDALERDGMRSRLVLQVHDEVIVEAMPEEEGAVEALTEDALTHAVALSVPLEVTMAWGESWAVKGG